MSFLLHGFGEDDVAGEVGEDDAQAKGSSRVLLRSETCWPCSATQTQRSSKAALSRLGGWWRIEEFLVGYGCSGNVSG